MHSITYKSRGHTTQIDYIMYQRSNLVEMKDCKFIPGDHVAPQHWLLVMDMWLRRPRKGKKSYEKMIRWTALKEEPLRQESKVRMLSRVNADVVRVQNWWRVNAQIVREVAREVLYSTWRNIWKATYTSRRMVVE